MCAPSFVRITISTVNGKHCHDSSAVSRRSEDESIAPHCLPCPAGALETADRGSRGARSPPLIFLIIPFPSCSRSAGPAAPHRQQSRGGQARRPEADEAPRGREVPHEPRAAAVVVTMRRDRTGRAEARRYGCVLMYCHKDDGDSSTTHGIRRIISGRGGWRQRGAQEE